MGQKISTENADNGYVFRMNQPTIILLVDPKSGSIFDANDGACQFYGYTKQELLRKNITDINILPKKEVFKKMEEVNLDINNQFIFNHRLANGKIKEVKVHSGPIKINNRSLIYSIIHEITDKQEFRKILEQSNRDIRQIFNKINDPIMLIEFDEKDKFKGIIDVNNQTCLRLGYTREEFFQFTALKLSKIFVDKEIFKIFLYKLLQIESLTWDIDLITKNGEKILTEINCSLLELYSKKIGILVIRDITIRKKIEIELKNAYSKANQIFNNTGDGMCIIDLDFNIVKINARLLAVLKLKENEVIGKKCFEIFHSNYCSTENCSIIQLINGKKDLIHEVEKEITNEKVPFIITSTRLMTANDKIAGIIQSYKGISRLKNQEKKVKQYLDFLRHTINSIPDIIIVLKPDFTVKLINEAGCEYFNISLEEIRGKNLCNLSIGKDFCNKFYNSESDTVIKACSCEKYLSKVDRYVDCYCKRILDEDNKVSLIVQRLSDITEKKRNEEILKTAKQYAEEANKFKTQFLVNMSHEIRTPMNGIISIIDLLNTTNLNDEQKEYINMLGYSADRLMRIINDILDLKKIEAGKLKVEYDKFDAHDLLINVINYFSLQVKMKNLRFFSHIDFNIPKYLIGDSNKLNQILFNLLGNAIKFTEKGYIGFEVKIIEEGKENIKIEFVVRDTGIGVAKDRLNYIFESFNQIDCFGNKKYKGTGLGLTITKKLVQLMGGEIFIDSEYSKGTSFSVLLKFEFDSLDNGIVEDSFTQGRNLTNEDPFKLNILLAEDEYINKKIVKRVLEKNDWDVTVASDGKEVFRYLEEKVFDIILMDINMPDIDGYKATRMIRNSEKELINSIPIIAMTAAAMQEDKERCIEIGMNAYISKPVKAEKLYNIILNVLAGKLSQELLTEKLEGDEKLLNEIIKDVISYEYEKEYLGNIEKHIINGDFEKLSKQTHKFKGNISYFQVEAIVKLLEDIESKYKSGDLKNIEDVFINLKKEFMKFKNSLIKYQKIVKRLKKRI